MTPINSRQGNIVKIDQQTTKMSNLASTNSSKQASKLADEVSVSTLPANLDLTATHFQQLQTQLLQPSAADFDAAKVAEIRLAISEGRYQVNTDKIADGLIDDVRDFLNTTAAAK
ncbi:flagellar biosynthesis anti-sigma factor FlgM [Glaciimonas soli]|uniref:Negative regulator of flagellin synthesis n=1 Tax=Glaciimonas soli TaxID=2590999 RepID=A0A843YPS6_9BURK|nr:flagellar biosynthesis anti-sigma factor FlgM [Glaciimonas soli]MQQ99467.1 flagellar biosynthesis anti-sigma factor FlgM [Glaciimonas soli]